MCCSRWRPVPARPSRPSLPPVAPPLQRACIACPARSTAAYSGCSCGHSPLSSPMRSAVSPLAAASRPLSGATSPVRQRQDGRCSTWGAVHGVQYMGAVHGVRQAPPLAPAAHVSSTAQHSTALHSMPGARRSIELTEATAPQPVPPADLSSGLAHGSTPQRWRPDRLPTGDARCCLEWGRRRSRNEGDAHTAETLSTTCDDLSLGHPPTPPTPRRHPTHPPAVMGSTKVAQRKATAPPMAE